jgi:hypothetical protein
MTAFELSAVFGGPLLVLSAGAFVYWIATRNA